MSKEFTINKNIPIMFLLALALQFIYFVNFISSLDARLHNSEKQLIKQEALLSSNEENVQGQQVSLAGIDANIKHIRDTVDRLINGTK